MLLGIRHTGPLVSNQSSKDYLLRATYFAFAYVPRPVACCNNPGSLLPVDRCEIFLQPSKLRSAWGEWSSIFGTRSTWLIGCILEVSLSIELDEMYHSMVPGVPKVFYSTRDVRWHTMSKLAPFFSRDRFHLLPMSAISCEV